MLNELDNQRKQQTLILLGTELIDNGTFVDGTDWGLQNGSSVGGGVGTVIGNGDLSVTPANWGIFQLDVFSATVPKTYRITYDARQTVGTGNFQAAIKFAIFHDAVITSSFQTFSFDATNTDATYLRITFGGTTISDEFEIDNVSVKEIL